MKPKGHHQRGYLPHRDYGGAVQAITFRLADSLPSHVVETWKTELQTSAEDPQKKLRRRIAHYEDAGHGACHLRQPEIAQIVQDTLIQDHDTSYKLIAWCIMPNHVHVLIRQNPESSLGKIIRSWKGGSARCINLILEREGPLWARDYFDRSIRDDEHFWNSVTYIHNNPVRAGLVIDPKDWPFSSLGHGWTLPSC